MAGWKEWLSGEVVEHTDLQSYIQNQVVQVYAGTAARSSVIGTVLTEGMVTYLQDTNQLQYYDGSAWLTIDTGTDPAIFTAGVSGQLLKSNGTAGVSWLNQGSVVAGSASYAGSADFATSSGTAVYSQTSGTATYSTNSGTAVYSTNSGTAIYATNAGTAVYGTNAGTAVYSQTSGTAVTISGSIDKTQVTGTAITTADTATVTNAMLAGSIENAKLSNSSITLNGSAVALGGSLTISGTGFSNPMTTLGDLIVGGTAGVAERLGIGAANTYLFTNGTTASWSTVATATTAGTASYATTSGTSVSISGSIAPTQVTAGTFNAGNFTFGSALTVTGTTSLGVATTSNTVTTGTAIRNVTFSTGTATGGSDGDIWLQYTA